MVLQQSESISLVINIDPTILKMAKLLNPNNQTMSDVLLLRIYQYESSKKASTKCVSKITTNKI